MRSGYFWLAVAIAGFCYLTRPREPKVTGIDSNGKPILVYPDHPDYDFVQEIKP
jgi:hypothetical protein